jgi:coniferyl-aldehyde dehydrogenase
MPELDQIRDDGEPGASPAEAAETAAAPSSNATGLHAAYEALRANATVPDARERLRHLAALGVAVKQHAEALVDAIAEDFGGRPRQETLLAEVGLVLENIRWTSRRLRRWVRPRHIALSPEFWPSTATVTRVPLGVVGILAPWNYPVQLALVPAIAALAGGNRILLKPSEFVPRTADLLDRIVASALPSDRVRVVRGDAAVARELTALPLDGIFYTGSTEIGRKVMAAAAETLTPVTLELGGKSPAIVLPGADLARAAESLMAGKLLNAGQTCIAPDYVLAPRGEVDALIAALRAATARLYPNPEGPDYAAIARPADRERLAGMLGANAEPLMDAMPKPPRLGAYVVRDPDPDHRLMREEIFGPILPVVPYDAPAEASAYVNARPCPLALYVYGRDAGACRRVVDEVRSGGAMINDCVMHVSAQGLPFGGAGESGLGAYHGEEGFRSFTRPRSVVTRRRLAPIGLARPPYGPTVDRLIRFLLR